jgi:coproporphyrinogen III oxidase-like Fe-S oxidoreductase
MFKLKNSKPKLKEIEPVIFGEGEPTRIFTDKLNELIDAVNELNQNSKDEYKTIAPELKIKG